ncbi:hypothetical protein [Pseudobythopirellula maris]|nr:hypothetical protein [Pseudobythopirellula maris]
MLLLLAAAMLTAPGCSCRTETPQERAARLAQEAEELAKKKAEQEQEQKGIALSLPTPMPGRRDAPSMLFKPGHWSSVAQGAKSNAEDFEGLLSQSFVDEQNDPLPTAGAPFALSFSRDIVLPKGAPKQVESVVWPPIEAGQLRMRTTLRDRKSGALVDDAPLTVQTLLDHQYHFLVLAKEASRYGFLDSLYSVNATLPDSVDFGALAPMTAPSTLDADRNYRVVAPRVDDAEFGILAPDNPLAWTSIACVVWDEVDPEALRPTQRDALVDWLHWGGVMLVNGPDSLDLLRGSFLDEFLPAESAGAREIVAADLAPLASRYGVARRSGELKVSRPWSGVRLTKRPAGAWAPGLDGLVAERRVGRGRMVVTAMQLAEPDLINWRDGVDNFYNAVLLRRPPRLFKPNRFNPSLAVVYWDGPEPLKLDPALNSRVRVFARDAAAVDGDLAASFVDEDAQVAGGFRFNAPPTTSRGVQSLAGLKTAVPPKRRGGVAAWRSDTPVANAAREALRKAAGVTVPGAGFVAAWLAAYLVLLVPMNWLFFKALGRVELAWIAAPIIALLGALVVVRQAQLDIGFVRARTEIAVIETQPEHPRAWVTRYNAFYTSLSAAYELEFDNPTAVATPFWRGPQDDRARLSGLAPVSYERLERSRLKGMTISSASTDFVMSEEVRDLGPLLRVGKSYNGVDQLENHSELRFENLVIVERRDGSRGSKGKAAKPRLDGVWIGELPPGEATPIALRPTMAGDAAPFAAQRQQARADRGADAKTLDLEPLFALALDAREFEPGERRVIASVAGPLDGLTVSPDSSQAGGAALVVMHLRYGPTPPPVNDKNAPIDVTQTNDGG